MGKRLNVILNSNPTNGVSFFFSVNVVSEYTTNFFSGVFKTTPVNADDILIGADATATATNLLTYLQTFSVPSYITFSRTGNTVHCDVEPDNVSEGNINISWSGTAGITFEIINTNVEAPLTYALVRSTYSLRITPNVFFDNVTMEFFAYGGDVNTLPTLPNYQLSKKVVQLGQSTISFDINHLITENTNPSIDNYLLTGLQPTQPDATCWVKYDALCFDGTDQVFQVEGTVLAMYGYGYFNEGFNPQLSSKVLISNNNQRHFRGEDNRLYFITDGLTSLEVNGDEITVTANLDLNTEYIQSINLKDYDTDDVITCEFVYEDETRTIIYDVLEECKYSVINCVFINKFGFPQSFFLTLVNKITDDVDGEDYRGLTSNFGIYNTTDHQYSTFNLNGRSAIICNTDYLNEEENENVKQMLLSEKKWFIEDGEILPVNLESKSVAYKTQLNDKLIQYSFNFKYSFDIINNVQ
jgi:hypothetical protein